jgi:hypothetical protein
MSNTTVLRLAGRTTTLSVAATAHAAVTVSAVGGSVLSSYASFLNTGSNTVAVEVSPTGITAVTASIGADSATGSFILPALMTVPIVLAVPTNAFQVSAIGSAAGPSLIYVTPLSDQS